MFPKTLAYSDCMVNMPSLSVAKVVIDENKIIFTANNFYRYTAGYYSLISSEEVKKLIINCVGERISGRKCNEVFDFIKIKSRVSEGEVNNLPIINLRNGLFDYQEWKFIEHSPDYLITSQLPADSFLSKECPLWMKTINEIFEEDQEKIKLIQEYMGLCLTKETKYEKALFLVGDGANGKSLVLGVLQKMLGVINYSSVPLEKFDNHFYLAGLFGKTVNISTETSAKASVYDSTFKLIVSGESITADHKHSRPFQFSPFCKLIFALNNLPRVSDKTNAFYRRIIVIRFNRSFSEEQQNKNLKYELFEEMDGIFNWCLEGLKRLIERGHFIIPKTVELEIEDFRKENNSVLLFFEEECSFAPYSDITKKKMYQHYVNFCRDNNYGQLSKNNFGKMVKQLRPELEERRGNRGWMWVGIGCVP